MDIFGSLQALTWMVPASASFLAVAFAWDARARAKSLERQLGAMSKSLMQPRRAAAEPALPLAHDREVRALRDELERLRSEVREVRESRETPERGKQAVPPAPSLPPSLAALREEALWDPWGAETLQPPSTPPAGRPVELQDGWVVPSRSLAAPGSLVPEDAGGQAKLYLNESVEINHVAFEQWSAFFDFRGGKPYMRYSTRVPSLIQWNESAGRGKLERKGVAEPCA